MTVWAVALFLGCLVLFAVFGIGFASRFGVAQIASLVLGCLAGGIASSVAIVWSRRVWPLFPVFLACGFWMVSVIIGTRAYLAAHGAQVTATVDSVECRPAKGGGKACTAQLRRPDGSEIGYSVSVDSRTKQGQTEQVIEDPVGIIALHLQADVDSVDSGLALTLLWTSAGLLALMTAASAMTGERHRTQGKDRIAGSRFDIQRKRPQQKNRAKRTR